jgi:large subunit ribosomal protein L19
MTDLLLEVEKPSLKSDVPAFSPGDSVRVYVKVREGEKERIQLFAGVVIARRGGGPARPSPCGRSREESVWNGSSAPLADHRQDRVERQGAVRRAKLYYLRERKGKAARIDEKQTDHS